MIASAVINVSIPLSWVLFPVIAILIYMPSINGTPIFDDSDVLSNLKTQFSWSKAWWRQAIRPLAWRARALTMISMAIQRKWPGTFRGYHLGNIAIHALCGVLVERIAVELGADPALALLTGILYIAHPFAVNTVGYITGRASLLSTGFGLAAVLAFLAGPVWAVALLWVASVYAKEDGVGFVPLLFALSIQQQRPVLTWCFVLVMAVGANRIAARYQKFTTRKNGDRAMRTIGLPVAHPQPWHGLTVFTETLIRLPFWAVGLKQSPYHGSGVAISSWKRVFLAVLVLSGLVLAFSWAPIPILLILGGPWLVYILCPVPDQLMEYRNYSMVAGFALLLAQILSIPTSIDMSLVWTLAMSGGAGVSMIYAEAWASPLEMWARAIRHSSGDPSRAFQELGAQYKVAGDRWQAELNLEEALRINPNLGPAMNNLAWLYMEQGKVEKAEEWFSTCIRNCPLYPVGWEDYGIFCDLRQRSPEAKGYYEEALRLEPRMEQSANRLGLLYFRVKDYPPAIHCFDHALKCHPAHFEYVYNKAVALKHFGKLDEGIALVKTLPVPLPLTPNMIHPEFAQ